MASIKGTVKLFLKAKKGIKNSPVITAVLDL
jgi:hypothetical protein